MEDLRKIRKQFLMAAEKEWDYSQIDVTPSISYLLNLPIPFNNLGSIIPEVILRKWPNETYHNSLRILASAYSDNANQIVAYIEEYYKTTARQEFNGFEFQSFKSFSEKFKGIMKTPMTDKELESLILDAEYNIYAMISHCRKIWTDFDLDLIYKGLAILVIGLINQLLTLWRIRTFSLKVIASIFLVSVFAFWQGYSLNTILFMDAVMLGFVFSIGERNYANNSKFNGWRVILISIASSTMFASNSFIIFEDSINRFLITTVVIYLYFSNDQSLFSTILHLVVLKVTSFFGVCREEQYPYCNYITLNGLQLIVAISISVIKIFKILKSKTGLVIAFALSISFGLAMVIQQEWLELNHAIQLWTPRMLLLSLLGLYVAKGDLKFLNLALTTFQRVVGKSFLLLFSDTLFVEDVRNLDILGYYLVLLNMNIFFITGHQSVFAAIQWESAFIGLDNVYYYVSMLFVFLNTNIGNILCVLYVIRQPKSERIVLTSIFLVYIAVPFVFQSFIDTILKRHLMIWKIFVPRWLLQGLFLITSFTLLILNELFCNK
jgi:hypothetical protein